MGLRDIKNQKFFHRLSVVWVIPIIWMLFLMVEGYAEWVHYLEVNLSEADFTLIGEDNGDWTGYFASPAGDVNGDGLGDILIGAPMAGDKVCPYPPLPDGTCPGLPKGQGVAYLVLGREGGLSSSILNLEQADAAILGCDVNSMTARQLYTAGDVNGDGYDDILVSGWKCGENYTGKAYLFLGRDDPETYWGRWFPVEQADASFLGENEWDFLSYYVSTAGDVNGDGYDDFLLTSTHHEYDEPCPPATPEDCVNCCKNFHRSTEKYNSDTNSWTVSSNLSTVRLKHTATVLMDGLVLVVGGQNITSFLDSAEIFDPVSETWTTTTWPLVSARSGHTATLLQDGKVLVVGGRNESGFLATSEIFDPDTETFTTTLENLNNARAEHTATLLPDGKVIVSGGQNSSGFLDNAEVFDPATGTWVTTLGNLNYARSGHTATLLENDLILISGGQNGNGFVDISELFNSNTGTWTETGALNNARSDHTATLLPDGKVLVVGGQDSSGSLFSSELFEFDPDTEIGLWTLNESLLKDARAYHTAVLMEDDRVLVVGGQNESGSTPRHELYDPFTAAWTYGITWTLNIARADHIAVPIGDGNVLVAGGRNCTDFGKVYLILGREAADWGADFDLSLADASFLGEAVDDRIGRAATGVGDVNGDGYGDFLIGAKSSDYGADDAGQNYLFLGRATENDPDYDPERPWWGNDYSVAWADASFFGEAEGDESGRRVAWAGDVNGDGLDDMLMQAALNDYAGVDAGITYLVLGRQEADWGMHYPLANADASFVGENPRDQSGRRMSGAGDVNNDGYDDFLTGAPHNEDGSEIAGIAAGKSYLIFGRPNVDWGTHYPLSRADIIYVGKPDIGVAGYDNAWLNDFNGDGIDDYLVSAYGGRNNDHVPGEAYVILGSETPLPVQFLPEDPQPSGTSWQRFTCEYWEPNDWQDIAIVEFVLDDFDGEKGVKVQYRQNTNEFYLWDNTVLSWIGPCIPGEPEILNGTSVHLRCSQSKVLNDDNHTLRVLWNLRWDQPLTDGETFDVYLRAVDQTGNDSSFVAFGNWVVTWNKTFLPFVMR